MGTAAKRMGRPTKKPKAGDRVSLGLRVTADMKKRLDAAAALSGRSQSQEAEMRIERSFDRQDLLPEVISLAYGEPMARLLLAMATAMPPTDKIEPGKKLSLTFEFDERRKVTAFINYGATEECEVQSPTDEEFRGATRQHTKAIGGDK